MEVGEKVEDMRLPEDEVIRAGKAERQILAEVIDRENVQEDIAAANLFVSRQRYSPGRNS